MDSQAVHHAQILRGFFEIPRPFRPKRDSTLPSLRPKGVHPSPPNSSRPRRPAAWPPPGWPGRSRSRSACAAVPLHAVPEVEEPYTRTFQIRWFWDTPLTSSEAIYRHLLEGPGRLSHGYPSGVLVRGEWSGETAVPRFRCTVSRGGARRGPGPGAPNVQYNMTSTLGQEGSENFFSFGAQEDRHP